MGIKKIPINMLSTGMYVVSLDIEWPDERRYKNKHLIESTEQIDFFKTNGVQYVVIDPTLGKDIVTNEKIELLPNKEPITQSIVAAKMARSVAMTAIQSVYEGVRTGSRVDNESVKRVVSSLIDTLLYQHDVMLSLIHMQRNDLNMFDHAVNVCAISLIVGKNQGYSKHQLEKLGIGALLHDVGELRLPRNLLRKRGSYNEFERRLLQQHPILGVTILSESDGIHEDSIRIVGEHHERIDGSGYPAGLIGAMISPFSEIVGIVDLYDAMLSSREGRPPLQPALAIKELYNYSRKGFIDRYWTERLIRCLGIYPVGSIVELNTGEVAIVTATNPNDGLRPKIRIIHDNVHEVGGMSPCEIDLADVSNHTTERSILRALELGQLDDNTQYCLCEVVETL
jgi:HD-GYP domain-containing protein (c-di-GMP phosphodiesterase class II)